jgi:prevent-host-death family protein
MHKIIGVTELQRRFRSVFDEVVNENMPYVLTRGSRPEAVLVPYEVFLRVQKLYEQDAFNRVDRMIERTKAQNDDRRLEDS